MDLASQATLLSSAAAAGLLQAALTGDPEATLPGFAARLDDLHYRPGAEVTASYTATYEAGGQTRTEHLLATTAEVSGQVATLTGDGVTLRVWRHPADPRLPGLAAACDPATVLDWLGRVGVDGPAHLSLDLLAYRPLRRAVLRVGADDQEYYLKVLRPSHEDPIRLRHELLARDGLSVPVLAQPVPGVLLLPRAPGGSLAQLLAAGTAVPGSALIAALDRLPRELLDLPRRPSWSDRLDFHAATARDRLPAEAARIDQLARRIEQRLGAHRHGQQVPTHGDCHETNIFIADGEWRFIDVDSAGPGLREDDLACALAHLAVLPLLDAVGWQAVPAVTDTWQAAFVSEVDSADLFARTAAVVVSLIGSVPVANGQGFLDLAEHYAELSIS